MRRRAGRSAALMAVVLLGLQGVAIPAPRTLIKMATLAPDGSAWDKALKRMGAEWSRLSDGEAMRGPSRPSRPRGL